MKTKIGTFSIMTSFDGSINGCSRRQAFIDAGMGKPSQPKLAVARSICLRLPEGAKLWDPGREFTALNMEALRAALGP